LDLVRNSVLTHAITKAIPIPSSLAEAAQLLGRAATQLMASQHEHHHANLRFEKAKLYAEKCGFEATQAEKSLHSADIYYSRVMWTISRSAHHSVLPKKRDYWLSKLDDIVVQVDGRE
jgi:hypothetical protein